MPREESLDPLGTSADPRRYVPIPTSERALAALQAGIRAGRSPLLLQGPSGIGKTLLLRVLAEREMRAGRRVLFSPFLHLPPEDVAPWLYHLVGWPRALANTSDAQLVAELGAHGLRTTLLIVDEIQSATPASARRLAELANAAGPTLQLVTAGRSRGDRSGPTPELRPGATVLLDGSLPPAELRTLCDAFLARAGVPPELKGLGLAERARVVERARGVPALLVAELLRCSAEIEVHGSRLPAPPAHAEPPCTFSRAVAREAARTHEWNAVVSAGLESALRTAPIAPFSPAAAAPWRAEAIPSAPVRRSEVKPMLAIAPPPPRAHPPRLRASARRLASAAPRALQRARRFARAAVERALALGMAAASMALRAFVVLLALLSILAHALRARLLLGVDRGNEQLEHVIRGSAQGVLHAVARVDAVSERWDAVGAPAWDQLARELRETGARALRFVLWQLTRTAVGACMLGLQARDLGANAASAARERAIQAALRTQRASRRFAAAARTARELAAARARAIPAQLAATLALLPTPRVPMLSQHQVLIAASLVALLALHAGGVRDDSAVAAPAPAKPASVVAPVAAAPIAAPAPIRVRVNARPWAFIRVDGVEVGPTPLSHLHLDAGPHEFEAEFADGRRLKQEVVIGPEQFSVSLR